jgi:hypothetical protein
VPIRNYLQIDKFTRPQTRLTIRLRRVFGPAAHSAARSRSA